MTLLHLEFSTLFLSINNHPSILHPQASSTLCHPRTNKNLSGDDLVMFGPGYSLKVQVDGIIQVHYFCPWVSFIIVIITTVSLFTFSFMLSSTSHPMVLSSTMSSLNHNTNFFYHQGPVLLWLLSFDMFTRVS